MGRTEKLPVLEMEMDAQSLKISLADEQASLSVRLPKSMVEGIAQMWQAFQNGTALEETAYSRHYTGSWEK